jgi:hypothetical protein
MRGVHPLHALLLLALIGGCGGSEPPPPVRPGAHPAWERLAPSASTEGTRFAPSGLGFECLFPGAPTVRSTERFEGPVSLGHQATARLTLPDARYSAFVTEHPAGVVGEHQRLFDELAAMISRTFGARAEVVRDDRTFRDGYPSRTLTYSLPRGAAAVRLYIGRRRLYGVVVALRESAGDAIVARVREFFGSVRLEAADAPGANGNGEIGEWRYIYESEASFACLLPGSPARRELDDGRGRSTRAYSVGARGGPQFSVLATDYGGRPPGSVLDDVDVEAVARGFTVVSSRAIYEQGYAGRRVEYRGYDGSVQVSRYHLTSRGIYELRASYPRDLEAEVLPMIGRFFRSFRIV